MGWQYGPNYKGMIAYWTMQPGIASMNTAKRHSQIQINSDHSNMSIQSEVDQILSYVLFPNPRIRLR